MNYIFSYPVYISALPFFLGVGKYSRKVLVIAVTEAYGIWLGPEKSFTYPKGLCIGSHSDHT